MKYYLFNQPFYFDHFRSQGLAMSFQIMGLTWTYYSEASEVGVVLLNRFLYQHYWRCIKHMESVTQVQIFKKAVFCFTLIPLRNAWLSLLPSAMGKKQCKLGYLALIWQPIKGNGKLWIQTSLTLLKNWLCHIPAHSGVVGQIHMLPRLESSVCSTIFLSSWEEEKKRWIHAFPTGMSRKWTQTASG